MSVGFYDTWACGLRDDGVIECIENFATRHTLTPATGSFDDLAASLTYVCGLRSDGVIQCIGVDGVSQVPDSILADSGSFTGLAVAPISICGVNSNGDLECRGQSQYGEAPSYRPAPSGLDYIDVATSTYDTCVLRSDGVVECFGLGTFGGTLSTQASSGVFVALTGMAGSAYCGLRDDGGIECKDDGFWGLPGGVLTRVGGYVDAGPGYPHMCAARPDGLVECHGGGSGVRVDVPFAPDSVGATLGTGVIVDSVFQIIALRWTDNSFAESHTTVQRRVGANGAWATRATLGVDADSLADGQFVAGLVYQYRIQSCNALGCSAWITSPLIDTSAPTTAPAAPDSVGVAGLSLTSFDVTWRDRSTDESSFAVQRQTRSALGVWSAWSDIAVLGWGAQSYADRAATPGIAQRYRVRACNAAGCSTYATSAVTRTPVPARPELYATTIHPMRIDLNWGIHPSSVQSGFDVQRRRDLGSGWEAWTVLAATPAAVTTYMDEDVAQGGRYQYRVRACSVAGCSLWSAVATAFADLPPLAPSNVVASPTSPSAFLVSWTDESDGETSFRVMRRARIGGVWEVAELIEITDPNVTSVSDEALPSGVTYRYSVRACNAAGCSTAVAGPDVTTP